MDIRKPNKDDVKGLINLSKKFANEYEWAKEIPIGKIIDIKEAKKWLFGNNVYKVLVAEEEYIVGYVGIKEYEDSYEASILVDSDYRGEGIGKSLTNKIFKMIPEEIEVDAWVADFNKLSLKVTPRIGFDYKKKFLEKDFIPGREFYVYIFTRKGEKNKL